MSLNDLRQLGTAEAIDQLATGTLTIWPRERSAGLPGVGFGDQAVGDAVTVRAIRQPESSYGMAAGGGEVEVLSRRFGVRRSDLAGMAIGRGTKVLYREDDASDGTPGQILRGQVSDTSDAMGGQRVMLMVEIDRSSSERGSI